MSKNKIHKLLFGLLFFTVSLDGLAIPIGSIKIHFAQFIWALYAILYFIGHTQNRTKILKFNKLKFKSLQFINFIFFLVIIPFSYSISYYPEGTIKQCFLMVINISLAIFSYKSLENIINIEKFIIKTVKWNLVFVCVIILLQIALTLIGLKTIDSNNGTGLLNIGRPNAFFEDAGWLGFWLAVLHGMYSFFYQRRLVSQTEYFYTTFFLLLIGLVIGTRITLLFLLLHVLFFVRFTKSTRLVVIIFSILSTIFILTSVKLPKHFLYDLTDLSRNPRLNDLTIFISEVFKHKRLYIGMGLGSLPYLNNFYKWREFSASNVLFGDIFFSFGILGLIFSVYVIQKVYKKIKNRHLKFIFIEIIILTNFHNSVYKQFFWVLLALLLFYNSLILADKEYNENKNSNN